MCVPFCLEKEGSFGRCYEYQLMTTISGQGDTNHTAVPCECECSFHKTVISTHRQPAHHGKCPCRFVIVESTAPVKLHVRARLLRFARKFNSDSCMAAPYVQVRIKRRLRCPDQRDPRPDPNPNPNPNPNPTQGGSRSALEVGRGCSTEFTCNSKNLARTWN